MPNTIQSLAPKIRRGELSPMDVLGECLAKIDQHEEKVHAWVSIDRDGAKSQAESLASEIASGQYRGPLHGIPIGIKDIFDVADWPTAAGSKHWANAVARQDCTVVEKLRQAGAIIMGKTVTTQFASFDPPVTRNPWNLERTPGGSSSGSAAAVACGMCVAAMGSQTGGSITRPASYCGVAGCKPTYGRVSLSGIMPLAYSMDHPGPFACCVYDLAVLLQTIAGYDSADSTFSPRSVPDFAAAIHFDRNPPKVGIVRGLFENQAEPPMRSMMQKIASKLEQAGASILPFSLPASFSEVIPRHRTVMAVEAAMFHRHRLKKHADEYLPNILALIEEGLNCPAPEYADCKVHQKKLTEEMVHCFQDVDALLTPAAVGPAPITNTTGNPAFNSPWSYSGFPTISIPADYSDDGLPLSIQLVAAPWQEANLFDVAAWCERTIGLEERLSAVA